MSQDSNMQTELNRNNSVKKKEITVLKYISKFYVAIKD